MAYVSLHLHSTYSFLDGFGHPKDIIKKVKSLGQTAAAITDHGNTSGWIQWDGACKEQGIKPIFGCEFYVVDDIKKNSQKKYHLTVLAKNLAGYQNILRLTTKAWSEGFYYKPTVDWNWLRDHKEGLIALSGCISSKLSQTVKEGQSDEEITKEYKRQKALFGNYFIEVSPMRFPEGNKIIKGLLKLAKQNGEIPVATSDSHYIEKEESKLHEVLLAIQSNAKMDDPKRWKFDQDDFYIKSEQEMQRDMETCFPGNKLAQMAISETDKVASLVESFDLPKAKNMEFPVSGNKAVILAKMSEKGLRERLSLGPTADLPKLYRERLKYELELIKTKNFIDYFLIIADLVVWAKDNGILVGPARGSSAGSLVCWATRITEVDPIKWELIFERFIDINRIDPPDIDIDFQDDKKEEIREYLEGKYGKDKVAGIATFMKFKGKLIIQDIARVYSLPQEPVNILRPLFVDRSMGDSRAAFVVTDVFKEFDVAKNILAEYPEFGIAMKLEGQLRQFSSHAAGIVLSKDPFDSIVSVIGSKENKVIGLEKYDAEKIGLLKIDALSLNTLTILQHTLDIIKERHGKIIDLYNLPVDDPKVYEKFRSGKLFGVFQFEGEGLYAITKEVKPESFKHLSDIMALARPGPLHAGSTNKYIERKNSGRQWKRSHPLVEELSKDTYGVVIYQEQVMRIMREIGLLSWEDANKLRKIMSNRLGTEGFNRYKEKFDKGASSLGVTQEQTDEVWNGVCTFGSWAMNKSHTISYSILSYWCMHLKVYYPLEFYKSSLAFSDSDEKIRKILREYRNEGNQIIDPDINQSGIHFSIKDKGLQIGLADISGIGETTAEKIVHKQPYRFAYEIPASKNIVEKLKTVGALQSIGNQQEATKSIFEIVEKDALKWKRPADKVLRVLCPAMVSIVIKPNQKKAIEKAFDRNLDSISTITGETEIEEVLVAGLISKLNLKDINEVSASKGQQEQKQISHPELIKYVNFNIEDNNDTILVTIPRIYYPYINSIVWQLKENSDILVLRGYVRRGIRKIYAYDLYNPQTGKRLKAPRKRYQKTKAPTRY